MLDQRKKVFLAAGGSVGIHLLLLLLWALAVEWLPRGQTEATISQDPIQLTIDEEKPVPTIPPPEVAPETPPPVHFLDTSDMAESASPPPDPKRGSAKNTADTSELPAEGTRFGPTQRGRQVPTFALNTVESPPDATPADSKPGENPPPSAQTAPPLPRAVAQASLPPAAKPPPAATPPLQQGDFALNAPSSIPAQPVVESNPYDPSIRTPASLTEPPHPTPVFASSRRASYQPQQLKTSMSGSINNHGPGSVASVATPLGRYQNTVIETIRRRWYGYLDKRTDLASIGQVTIHFLVGMDGRARSTQVVANTANEALASISLQAILDARLPPMPAEAVPDTSGGQMPMDLTFEFVDSANF